MNCKRVTKSYIERSINALITIDLPDGELDEIVSEVEDICDGEYDLGYKNGIEDGVDEGYQDGKRDAFDDANIVEKFCTEYAVKQFADCHTLADFQDKLKEITSRSYNFM